MKEKGQSSQRSVRVPKLKAAVFLLGLSNLWQLRKSSLYHGQFFSLPDDFHFIAPIRKSSSIFPVRSAEKADSHGRPDISDIVGNAELGTSNQTTDVSLMFALTNAEKAMIRTFGNDASTYVRKNDGILSTKPVDPVLQPIIDSGGRFYILNRRDRSGRVIADMMYAHAFAFANNLTFAGLCWIQGKHKREVHALIHDLKWSTVLPFACPNGLNPEKFAKKYSPNQNATEISPLILNFDVFKIHSNLSRDWIRKISADLSNRKHMIKHSQLKVRERSKPYEIAVQVRRGDIEPCKFAVRYLPNSHYLSLIDRYTPCKEELNGRPVRVTIYSESSSYETFDDFLQRGYSVELDSPKLADVWRALATADVAILSRSYFSMIPAIVNPNTVVMTDYFQFGALEGWKVAHLSDEDESKIIEMRDECRNKTNGTL